MLNLKCLLDIHIGVMNGTYKSSGWSWKYTFENLQHLGDKMVKSSCSPHPGPHHEAPHCFMYRCKETHTQIQFFFTIRIVLQLAFEDFPCKYMHIWASQVALVVKNPPANASDLRDLCSIPESGRFPWRRAWQPTRVVLPGKSHGLRNLAGYSP